MPPGALRRPRGPCHVEPKRLYIEVQKEGGPATWSPKGLEGPKRRLALPPGAQKAAVSRGLLKEQAAKRFAVHIMIYINI